jgi:hypothetical protein
LTSRTTIFRRGVIWCSPPHLLGQALAQLGVEILIDRKPGHKPLDLVQFGKQKPGMEEGVIRGRRRVVLVQLATP